MRPSLEFDAQATARGKISRFNTQLGPVEAGAEAALISPLISESQASIPLASK